jgi:hypothetical protein
MKIIIISIIIVAATVSYFMLNGKGGAASAETDSSVGSVNKKNNKKDETSAGSVDIQKTWNMPEELREISGLVSIGNNQFACVQDEEGKIFIYNADNEKVEEVIAFGEPGDYEGIAVASSSAYVVNSSGQLTEIKNYRSKQRTARTIATPLTAKQNVEGLCYDAGNERLLLAVKDADLSGSDYKGIYAYDLKSEKFMIDAVYKIPMSHEFFENNNGKKKKGKSEFFPSGISIHPQTNDLYVVDGRRARMLIVNQEGKLHSLTTLSDPAFSQPEGITFDNQGNLFISNEGVKNSGNILKVSMK